MAHVVELVQGEPGEAQDDAGSEYDESLCLHLFTPATMKTATCKATAAQWVYVASLKQLLMITKQVCKQFNGACLAHSHQRPRVRLISKWQCHKSDQNT